jgi:hypothetical protein
MASKELVVLIVEIKQGKKSINTARCDKKIPVDRKKQTTEDN